MATESCILENMKHTLKEYIPEGGCPCERGCDNDIDVDVHSIIKNESSRSPMDRILLGMLSGCWARLFGIL